MRYSGWEIRLLALRLQVPHSALLVRLLLHTVGKAVLATLTIGLVVTVGTFVYFYAHYSRLIDDKLAQGAFAQTSGIFAAPSVVGTGDAVTAAALAERLTKGGYSRDTPTAPCRT